MAFDLNSYLSGGQGFAPAADQPTVPSTQASTQYVSTLPYSLSAEQQLLIEEADKGNNVIVNASIGSGKTSAIQELCNQLGTDNSILYLTYSRLLKEDAQRRVKNARVQNYHGIVYPSLRAANISCGISESIATFNRNFKKLSNNFPVYDILVIDEYQDITEEYAELLWNIKSKNPMMQIIMVGDMEQKIRSDTVLDVEAFAKEFCEDPVYLSFTQSFRMGDYMGKQLSLAWNKPISGVNHDQEVIYMSPDEVLNFVGSQSPGDLLCLGRRNGMMSDVLNALEEISPKKFNKNTVYASIRDRDSQVAYGDDVAIFTTFDSSKGLERPICVIFDYDEMNWGMRLNFPNADPLILRNVFLVAASRGKQKIVFVTKNEPENKKKFIGDIFVSTFNDISVDDAPEYDQSFWASEAFDFKYVENVEECYGLLDVTRIDNGKGKEIDIDRTDGLIDLSPAVGHYQEALYFTEFDAMTEIGRRQGRGSIVDQAVRRLNGDPWHDSLALTAVDTGQLRYLNQVDADVPSEVAEKLVERLATILPKDVAIQQAFYLDGRAMKNRKQGTDIVFEGVADAIYRDTVYELKFVSELTHPMFLQLGLYLVMSGLENGILWNTRTDERWHVSIPDRGRFMNTVVKTVTKQNYSFFKGQV